jgi:type IV pilus assembly protein PilP
MTLHRMTPHRMTPHSTPMPRPEGAPVRRGAALLLASVVALLAACEGETQELQEWMDQQRREVRPSVQPLAPPKKFDPVPYANAQQVDPFSNQKLSVALKQEARQPSSLLAAEMNRRKDPLEAFPLDAMSMVGSVSRAGTPLALLRVDNLLYQVKPGDYLGQNFGRITRITETELALREVVQDAAGEWIERTVTLQLQERAQEKAR